MYRAISWLKQVVLFYVLLLQDSVEALQYNYIEAEYQSQGAAVRVAMNAMPTVLFLWFRRRFAGGEWFFA